MGLQHSIGKTGFGVMANYTVVRSDTQFDNTLRYTVTQFAVTGVSDSANAVLYYDKKGLQGRIAYNWRASFLSGYGFDPYYVNAYGQWDMSASYEVRKGVTVFAEGINITNARGAATCAMTRRCILPHPAMPAGQPVSATRSDPLWSVDFD
jgi:outer membrane receptor protein involved in Fe transport